MVDRPPWGQNRPLLPPTVWHSSGPFVLYCTYFLDMGVLDALVTARIIFLPVPAVLS